MNKSLANFFNDSVQALSETLPSVTKAVYISGYPVQAKVYRDYDHLYGEEEFPNVETTALFFANQLKNGFLAFVPIALFENGEIMATLSLMGTLAEMLHASVRAVLLLRNGRWVCLDRNRNNTGLFSTRELVTTLCPIFED